MRNGRKEPGKYIGSYTARGTISEDETEQNGPARIRLFDGKFDTAFVVREFYIWSDTWSNSNFPDCIGKLSTSPNVLDTPVQFMQAQDSREIAWAGANGGLDTGGQSFAIVDPDNLIVEDLWVFTRSINDTNGVNYMVVMDKYDITESLGAVSMAKDRARDSENEWVDQ